MRIWALAALALAAEQAPAPFADLPNVTLQPYDVAGREAGAIRRSIDATRPTDSHDGKRVDALSHWDFHWRWHRDAAGRCSATADDLTFTATVQVPRLSDPNVSERVRAKWDRYYQSLLQHEDGHVRYAWDHRGDVLAAINGAGCDGAGEAARTAVRAIGQHDVDYDRATRHGATTVVPFT